MSKTKYKVPKYRKPNKAQRGRMPQQKSKKLRKIAQPNAATQTSPRAYENALVPTLLELCRNSSRSHAEAGECMPG
jgi:hypothetical protein